MRKTILPYCRWSWRHWGIGVFIYVESHARELAISLGPVCIGVYALPAAGSFNPKLSSN